MHTLLQFGIAALQITINWVLQLTAGNCCNSAPSDPSLFSSPLGIQTLLPPSPSLSIPFVYLLAAAALKHFNLIKFHVTQIPETVILSALDATAAHRPPSPFDPPGRVTMASHYEEAKKKKRKGKTGKTQRGEMGAKQNQNCDKKKGLKVRWKSVGGAGI